MEILPNIEFTAKLLSPEPSVVGEYSTNPTFNWNITFKKNDKVFEVKFHTGVGCINKEKPKYLNMKSSMQTIKVDVKRDGLRASEITVSNLAGLNSKNRGKWNYLLYKPQEPTKNGVLQVLALEASYMIDMPTFEDWCSDFGYNSDSIKDKKMFDAMYEQTSKLKSFLGNEDFQIILKTDFDDLEQEESTNSPSI